MKKWVVPSGTCGIYAITDKVSGRRYIGQSLDIRKRFRVHMMKLTSSSHDNIWLQRVWSQNPEAFEWEVLEVCHREELTEAEQFWINESEKVFNMRVPGDSGIRPSCSEHRKQKLSLLTKARWASGQVKLPEDRLEQSINRIVNNFKRKGRTLTAEQIQKLRLGLSEINLRHRKSTRAIRDRLIHDLKLILISDQRNAL